MDQREATRTAASEARAVKDSAKSEASSLTSEATDHVADVARSTREDLRVRANEEARKFAGTLRDSGKQLQQMADAGGGQNGGALPTLAREGASFADRVATRIDQGGLDAVFADVRAWARRNPATFLVGAAAAGFVVGRVVRNAQAGSGSNGSTPNGSTSPAPTASQPQLSSFESELPDDTP
jgi:hypothetical protein